MKTNDVIFQEITKQGFITKSQLQTLKNRSNREQKDVINYNWLESIGDGYGIPVTEEQGLQGLSWLWRFMKKDVLGFRERDIIKNAKPTDFKFQGFYDAGRYNRNFLPIYELNGMQYVPMAEPYIIG